MDKKTQRLYEFDKFRVDLGQKCLWRDADLVSLTPKAFDTLVVLIENRGSLVDKDTLLNKVWANTFVEESTLAQNISTLRKTLALQENGRQFIETVPRRGYRFVADVREIVDDEEIFVVETRTRTHIFAEQEIHNSPDSPAAATDLQKIVLISARSAFLTRNKLLLGTGILVLAITIGGFFAGNRYFNSSKPQFEENFRQFQISRLTSNGNVHRLAMSPDGKYVALVERKGEFQTLYLRQTNNANTIEIIPPTRDDFIGLTFAPDNEFIYYSVYQAREAAQPFKIGVLYKVPLLGGSRTEVLKDIDSAVAISPDNKKYAFIRQNPSERESALILFDCLGAGEIKLTTRKFGERFTETGTAWSPDGKHIAAVALSNKERAKPLDIIITRIEDGQQNTLAPNSWLWIGKISWLADGSGLIFSAFGENSPNMTDELWLASYPDGRTRQITNGINGFFGLGMTADSKSLITVKSDRVTSLWVSPIDKSEAPVMINKSIGDNSLLKLGINWTPDGKIIYSTAQQGNADIWTVNPDGTDPTQLTSEPSADFSPVASADGNFLVFISNRSGTTNVWRMSVDGTGQKQLSNFKYSFSPSISPDGKWIYFGASAADTNDTFLWKIPGEGGEPVQLTELPVSSPKVSPDGKFIVCHFPEKTESPNQSKKLKLTILSAADASIIKQFDEPNEAGEVVLAWTPDSKAVSYVITKNNASSIWIQPIDGAPAQKALDGQTDEIFRYSWSNNNKKLVFEKGMTVNDIVIIRDSSVLTPNKK